MQPIDRSSKFASAMKRTSSPLRRLNPKGWVNAQRVKAAGSARHARRVESLEIDVQRRTIVEGEHTGARLP